MQVPKTRAIGVDDEHRSIARTAATIRRPVQVVARYNQSGIRIKTSVAVASEAVQGGKARAIGVDLEYRARLRTAARNRCPIQGVARQHETIRINSVGVGVTCKSRET